MKKVLGFLLFLLTSSIFAQQAKYQFEEQTSPDGKFKYQTVSNDPLKVRIYTLSNGLTVMLSVNKSEPRIQTMIATKAGSKNDPSDNTGLAHYLEHMLFKGTQNYGTKDWVKEKEQLDKIDQLYEQYNKTTDEDKRKVIYHLIDSVSGVASQFAIANEYDKMVQSIGAKGTNAFTSLEQTVYVNDIPSNQVEKWLSIEAERFHDPVMRLFHTELEAVYEEKNIGLDNDGRKVFEALMENLFTNHAYGTQTTIGTVEHLKNPSLIKIRNYYNTYYVPNNMAIIMSGDFDPDKTIEFISQKFSYMQSKPVPEYTFKPEPVHSSPIVSNVYGPDAENLMIGFRLPGAASKEAKYMAICDYILSNSKAGLIDLNLVKKQKVLAAGSQIWPNKDYSIHMLTGKPKKNQSLEEVKDMLLQQMDLIKKGEFDEESLIAIINNFKVDQIRNNETNSGRASAILDAFTASVSWNEVASYLDDLSKITKQELVDFANKYYTNDYVIVYKNQGESKNVKKVPKPEITPVSVNRQDMSPFVKNIIETKAIEMKPVFIDYDKDIAKTKLVGKVPVYYVQNTENGLFKLYYVLDMGKLHDLKLPQAINLLQYLGTEKFSAEDISKEFFKLACDFGVSTTDEQVYVYLSGLDENFAPAVRLFEHLLSNVKPDQQALNNMVDRTLKSREDAKLNKNTIFRTAMRNYAVYGKKNPFTYNLSADELKSLKAEELVKYIKELNSYQHKVYYYGPRRLADVNSLLAKEHKIAGSLKAYPKRIEFKRNETATNAVLFTDYKMVQAEIMWLNKHDIKFDTTLYPMTSMFNEYFGGGMSSVVFQTIRESKALAYSTYSFFQTPSKKVDPYYTLAYVGTQADKLNEAIPAMNDLLQNMPKTQIAFTSAKDALKNQLETERINKEGIIFNFASAELLGVHHDTRRDVYNSLDKMTFDDIQKFYDANYKGKKYTYCVMGSKDKISTEELSKYGTVTILTLQDIFGY